ncbi:MAG: hypothetical protein SAJ12_04125 [Jaaginema sp. PMC 1079.18]|nr:hypothetical protein [Jaaginema sp. PMC 1080.18]MEC4850176.1 hypothetical protein [Jaaginema sp. PMC 1079.18]MEC4865109.1 hypothetical protein [Jaaginema sp. PMC 1078.18]
MLDAIIERAGDWNPQLFRELKGQLKPRGLIIVGFLSFLGQLLIYLAFASQLHDDPTLYSPYVEWKDGVGIVNWSLWSADIFVTLSYVAFFGLLVIGTYLLTADLGKETRQGTLNFIRMSPQSATSILVGKMLGVPALLYWGLAIAFPFHFAFGIAAGIPWYNVIGFDLILVAACACFYSLALLIGLLPLQEVARSSIPFGVAAVTLMYLGFTQMALVHSFGNIYNFLFLFQPGVFLQAIALEKSMFFTFQYDSIFNWYQLNLQSHPSGALLLGLVNFSLWTYWLWQGIKRRFNNAQTTLWSKTQSYWVSGSLLFLSLGFAFATFPDTNYLRMEHLAGIQFFYFLFCMVLIVCITPSREQVQIWSLHRPQYRRGIASFIFDEKSPAVLAVGINGLILYLGVVLYAIASVLLPSNTNASGNFLLGTTLACLAINWLFMIFCASIYQVLSLVKSRRRIVLAKSSLLGLIFLWPLAVLFLLLPAQLQPMLVWLCTPFAMFTVTEVTLIEIILAGIGQSLAVIATLSSIKQRTDYLGMSEAKILLNNNASTAIR